MQGAYIWKDGSLIFFFTFDVPQSSRYVVGNFDHYDVLNLK